ncbi:MAG: pyrroline-5-carboxylate reductase [Acidobacteria bacterium]|nr:MAG: pyrroline-5-carboxylate reductase [Acidobacteriota bacterium]
MFENQRIAVLGAGKLGEALITGMLDAGIVSKKQFIATAGHRERLEQVRTKLDVETTLSNSEAVRKAHLVLLCVKPQTVEEVLRQVKDDLTPGHLVISVVASVTTRFIESILDKTVPVIRTMPNTPCLIKQGMTAIAPGKNASFEHIAQARKIFDAIGRTLILDEKHMDAVTGLSASGPAFVYIIIESFVEAGVKVGLPREVATQLAAQMVLGAASMVLETGEHPAKLKDIVTTPAGCTIDGILELEDGGLRVTLIKAVVRATQRAKELVNG